LKLQNPVVSSLDRYFFLPELKPQNPMFTEILVAFHNKMPTRLPKVQNKAFQKLTGKN
jgi:hypothetical protein